MVTGGRRDAAPRDAARAARARRRPAARGLRCGDRARGALAGRGGLLVRLHLGHAGPGRAAHHHRPRHRARLPGRRAQHRRRRAVLRRRDRGDLGRAARRRPAGAASRSPSVLLAAIARGHGLGRGAGLAQAALRRARGDQHAAAQFRRRVARQPDGSGTAAGRRSTSTPRAIRSPRRRDCRSCRGRGFTRDSLLALVGAAALWYVFARTLWGFRLRAVGAGPARGGDQRAHRRAPHGRGGTAGARARWRGSRAGSRSAASPTRCSRTSRRVRLHRHRRGAARAASPAAVSSRPASCSVRSRRGQAPCSGTPACPRWRYTWWRRW